MCIYIYTYIYVCIHTCMYTYIHVYVYIYVYEYIYTYKYTCISSHRYISKGEYQHTRKIIHTHILSTTQNMISRFCFKGSCASPVEGIDKWCPRASVCHVARFQNFTYVCKEREKKKARERTREREKDDVVSQG